MYRFMLLIHTHKCQLNGWMDYFSTGISKHMPMCAFGTCICEYTIESMSLRWANLHCPPRHEASGEGGRPLHFLGLLGFRFPKPPNPKTASLSSGLWARRTACSAKNTYSRVTNSVSTHFLFSFFLSFSFQSHFFFDPLKWYCWVRTAQLRRSSTLIRKRKKKTDFPSNYLFKDTE